MIGTRINGHQKHFFALVLVTAVVLLITMNHEIFSSIIHFCRLKTRTTLQAYPEWKFNQDLNYDPMKLFSNCRKTTSTAGASKSYDSPLFWYESALSYTDTKNLPSTGVDRDWGGESGRRTRARRDILSLCLSRLEPRFSIHLLCPDLSRPNQ